MMGISVSVSIVDHLIMLRRFQGEDFTTFSIQYAAEAIAEKAYRRSKLYRFMDTNITGINVPVRFPLVLGSSEK